MDNSLKTKEKTPEAGGGAPAAKGKTKTFLIGKELKTNTLRHTAAERASGPGNQNQNQNTRIAYAERASQAATRLLRFATALRVTAPLGCGSDSWYGRKVPFGPSERPGDRLIHRL